MKPQEKMGKVTEERRYMDIISPKTDFCAKELFSHEVIRKYFISDVTGIPVGEIKSVRLCNPYLWRHYRKQKLGILDVLVEMNSDVKINIELQIKFYSYWDRRSLYYLAKMFTEDLRVGEDYSKLKKCICISLLDFNLSEEPEYHRVYHLRDKNGKCFTDLFEVHMIELRKQLEGKESLDDWIRFFNARTEEELDMIHSTNVGINTAIGEVKKMSMSERMRARYEAHMKEIRDRHAREDYIRKQGFEEGIERGITKSLQDSIIEFLSEHGEVDMELQEQIMRQKDEQVLREWTKNAVQVNTVEEFRNNI